MKQKETSKKQSQKASEAMRRSVAKVKKKASEHRKATPHRSFRLTRRSEIPAYGKVKSWWRLCRESFHLIISERKKVLGIIGLFVPVGWLVSGIYSQDFSNLKFTLSALSDDMTGGLEQAAVLFTGFFSVQSEGVSQDSLILLNVLVMLMWLSFIWITRYAFAKKDTTLREALYTSGASFVPFMLLLLLLVIQALPAIGAALIFNNMTGTGFIQGVAETAVFSVLAVLLIVLSLYFMSGTVVAMQVAALPGMYPWRALKNARLMIAGRRFSIVRKLLALAATIFMAWAIIFTPVLLFDNNVCGDGASCWSTMTILPLLYYILAGLTIAFSSTYIYIMYRSLLETKE